MPIQNLASEKRTSYFRALFVGPTGSGKSIAAASWPGRTLVLDFDNRFEPIVDWYPNRLKDFDVLVVNTTNFWSDFKPVINRVAESNPYQNVIVSGITSLSTTCVMLQMLNKGAFKDWKDASKDDKKGSKITAGGVMVPTWDEFNGEAMLISTLLECLKSFNCNLFVEAHPTRRMKIKPGGGEGSAEEYTSITTFGPKIESIIPTYFNEVWYFKSFVDFDSNSKPIQKKLVYTRPNSGYAEAKTSILKIPAVIDFSNNDATEGNNLYDKVKEYL